MLTSLHVQNLATLAALDLELSNGFIAITGDTGAGKSLILDALELALGGRADAGLVRTGTERADITACFDIERLPDAAAWLAANELTVDREIILRRTLTAEGRSKAFINGTPVSTGQLRELADQLVLMHTQHANQQLLQARHQLALVDAFADGGQLRNRVAGAFQRWRKAEDQLHRLQQQAETFEAERELLQFQADELSALNPQADEFETLDAEQKQLASAEQFLNITAATLALLDGEDAPGMIASLQRASVDIQRLADAHPALANATELLEQAAIAIAEARTDIAHAVDRFDLDPARLAFVESRLAELLAMARKHKTEPEALPDCLVALQERLEALSATHTQLPALAAEVEAFLHEATALATQLTDARTESAAHLSDAITALLPGLGMEHATLELKLISQPQLTAQGFETVQFWLTPNPGQQGGPLAKIASGGELSRVSLAIQVISASRLATPTLIFDEVDVGIGGKTAAKVGQLLQALSQNAQVLVVTHQPQVAGQAAGHLHVSKQAGDDVTVSDARFLSEDERIDEIARMLGGHVVTDSTRAAAAELRIKSGSVPS